MSYRIVIPALCSNQYDSINGDLTAFGDISLLEWKISQCLQYFKPSELCISTPSLRVERVAKQHNIDVLKRGQNIKYPEVIQQVGAELTEDIVIWVNPTSPFLGGAAYKNMLEKFSDSDADGLISVIESREYIFYEGKKLNFNSNFFSRSMVPAVMISTNGCCVITRAALNKNLSLFPEKINFYPVSRFEGIEIKDIQDLSVANFLLTKYINIEIEGRR